MKLLCKHCGEVLSLHDAMEDADGRRFVDLLKDIPAPLIKPYLRYLKLFKPAQRALTWSRMLRLTVDILPALQSGTVERNGSRYTVPTPAWVDVLTALVDTPPATLKTPLKDHGYLYAVVAGTGEKTAAKQEKQIEKARQHRAPQQPAEQPVRSGPPANWKDQAFKKPGG